jgi:hypothetical protein
MTWGDPVDMPLVNSPLAYTKDLTQLQLNLKTFPFVLLQITVAIDYLQQQNILLLVGLVQALIS